ncbi:MAG: pyrroline-5-carboxylate reductase [Gammaproteobacteria bacterium]|nr:pyrroline-5-carboxylate reductase [Gammaproteobacteria bacterium]
MDTLPIGFIGGGNMARSLIGGLVATSWPREMIRVADPDESQRKLLQQQLRIATENDNQMVVSQAKIVVLAVKPQILKTALQPLVNVVQTTRPLILSIVAGIRLRDIDRWLGGGLPVVRAMPNTPALVGSGASALFANQIVSPEQRSIAESILRAVGIAVWVSREDHLDAVTALSGSGPAYFLYIMEALEQAAMDHGLDRDTAHLLTLETCLGTAKMALESGEELAQLRRRVTSPGGTTERALAVMTNANVSDTLAAALVAATERAAELADMLGDD